MVLQAQESKSERVVGCVLAFRSFVQHVYCTERSRGWSGGAEADETQKSVEVGSLCVVTERAGMKEAEATPAMFCCECVTSYNAMMCATRSASEHVVSMQPYRIRYFTSGELRKRRGNDHPCHIQTHPMDLGVIWLRHTHVALRSYVIRYVLPTVLHPVLLCQNSLYL